jgi:hypothetical protein
MKKHAEPSPGSFKAAEIFQLKLALKVSHAQRLQDLQDMIDFNHRAELANPRLREIAKKLRD